MDPSPGVVSAPICLGMHKGAKHELNCRPPPCGRAKGSGRRRRVEKCAYFRVRVHATGQCEVSLSITIPAGRADMQDDVRLCLPFQVKSLSLRAILGNDAPRHCVQLRESSPIPVRFLHRSRAVVAEGFSAQSEIK